MAETYLAVQRGVAGFEQRVCVKFILPQHRDDAGFKQLFLREASIAASLRHSNIVGVIDVDQSEGYIVLELVDGVDLRALLTAAPNHRLPAPLVTYLAIELGKALSYAHSRTVHGEPLGVVHRDLSPSNVLISYAGEVKLADFGIAKAMHADAEPQSQTIKGKLCYMSPEQTRGESLDGTSDLFSLGVVCYELLAGRRPFDGQTDAETILRLNQGERMPLVEAAPDVPGGLAVVIERALCIDRAGRFANADAFIDALCRFAPSPVAYRELGECARRARPHETLSTTELDEFASAPTAPKPGRQAVAPARLRAVEAVSGQTPPTVPLGPSSVVASRRSRPSARAWAALGASLLTLAGVAIAWQVTSPRRGPTPSRPLAHAAEATAPAVAAAAPTTPGIVSTGIATPTPINDVQVAEAPAQPPPVKPEPETQPVPTPAEEPPPSTKASSHAIDAVLRVGTIPVGQVWVDGKPAGWSPVTVHLSAGHHDLAGGGDSPVLHKDLRLRAGEHRQLVLNLDEAAAATAGGNGR
jgi:serine/threonine protein kinase